MGLSVPDTLWRSVGLGSLRLRPPGTPGRGIDRQIHQGRAPKPSARRSAAPPALAAAGVDRTASARGRKPATRQVTQQLRQLPCEEGTFAPIAGDALIPWHGSVATRQESGQNAQLQRGPQAHPLPMVANPPYPR
ncbi:hypothetical protein GCM10010211_33970 [Streptomyces albospinus]|uniref:Uncharacterized protein n=1 Tax=Streptomyces albospinus TaxID=285515 RepID=A0ABQ2V2K2_9ACTN|nr:hypothetical protein GCM10010211_33970 [Streptomyces albospinus]